MENNDRIKQRQRFILKALMECQTEYRREKSYLNSIIIFKVLKSNKLTETDRLYRNHIQIKILFLNRDTESRRRIVLEMLDENN